MGAGSLAAARETLPAKSLPLSTLLTTLENQGFSSIVEAKFDDGLWEVECLRGANGVELNVDPVTGKIVSEHADHIKEKPAANHQTATMIVKLVEEAGYNPVLEVEWERDHWEVEADNQQGHRKLKLHAETGKILSDREDD